MNLLIIAAVLVLVNTLYYVLIFVYPDEVDEEVNRVYSVFWYQPSYTFIIATILIYLHFYYFNAPAKGGIFSRITGLISAVMN